jgi:hypothetical protein
MQTQTTLFNLGTMRPYTPPPIAVCGHCKHLVTIRNDNAKLWHYCGITECANSIIGCKQVKTSHRACRRYAPGKGEYLTANRIFKEISTH